MKEEGKDDALNCVRLQTTYDERRMDQAVYGGQEGTSALSVGTIALARRWREVMLPIRLG